MTEKKKVRKKARKSPGPRPHVHDAPRRVAITLEVHTTLPVSELRNRRWWNTSMGIGNDALWVVQAQANVIRGPRGGTPA